MYTTGNPVCDQLICADFSGNLIPQRWYRVFVKSELNRPKPHLLAVNILADIVYWYRPAVIRNERGQITGYRKKFRGDLLQRSYAQLAETFGCSARQAKEAILFLEQTGVIKRVLRTVQANGREYANVLFLSLNAARLMELTAPEQSSGVFSDTHAAEFRQTGDGIPADTPSGFCLTYTENPTTENPAENPSGLSACAESAGTDGKTDSPAAALLDDLNAEQGIPYAYAEYPEKMESAIRYLCDYAYYTKYPPEKTDLKTKERCDSYHLLLNCLVNMAVCRKTQQFCGEQADCYAVIDAVNGSLDARYGYEGALDDLMLTALADFTDALRSTHIRNYAQYAKSVLWNAMQTFRVRTAVKYGNLGVPEAENPHAPDLPAHTGSEVI